MKIIPALIAKNQEELDKRLKKVINHFDTFPIDVMDGRFVQIQYFNLPVTAFIFPE